MRKLTALLLALVLFGGVTVGCKKDGGDGTTPPAESENTDATGDGGGDGGGEGN